MDPAEFAQAPGRLVPTTDGAVAYVPPPVPRQVVLDHALTRTLDEATAAVAELVGATRRLPNPRLLIAPYLRREAVESSRIEGTQSTLTDVYEAESGQVALFETTDVREVTNYVRALEHGWRRLPELPLSLRLVKELHAELMAGVRGGDQLPGEFRRSQNFIGGTAGNIAGATYVPPPVPEMHEALDDFEHFLHEDAVPPLVAAAIAHAQFESIHPFRDGNGRVGRLLMPLVLHARGRLPLPVLYLSRHFERSRGEYYERLHRVNTHGDWAGWLRYFLTAAITQATAAMADADRLLALERHLRDRLYAAKARPTAVMLLDHLFVNPIITARRAEELLNVSNPGARKAIAVLEERGVLREFTGRTYGRRWVADEILQAIEGAS
jgi:Fic family protein